MGGYYMPFESVIRSCISDKINECDSFLLSPNKQRGQSITFTIYDSVGKPKWIAKFFDYLKDYNSVFSEQDIEAYNTLDELIENVENFNTTADIESIIDYIEIQKRCFNRYLDVDSKDGINCFPPLIYSSSELKIGNSFYGFLIEEFVEGKTLEQTLTEAIKDKFTFVYDFLLQMGDILYELSPYNIVHRDISPDNIIIKDSGKYILIDPGVVKIEDGNMTKSHYIFGKKAYVSPEQYFGNAKLATFKSDLYAVGIIALEIILGYNPLKEYISKTSEPHKELLHQYNRNIEDCIYDSIGENSISKRLVLIVNKMIQISDWDRFDSIETFINTLKTLDGQVIYK
jgi:serine/threonine protein kinase